MLYVLCVYSYNDTKRKEIQTINFIMEFLKNILFTKKKQHKFGLKNKINQKFSLYLQRDMHLEDYSIIIFYIYMCYGLFCLLFIYCMLYN